MSDNDFEKLPGVLYGVMPWKKGFHRQIQLTLVPGRGAYVDDDLCVWEVTLFHDESKSPALHLQQLVVQFNSSAERFEYEHSHGPRKSPATLRMYSKQHTMVSSTLFLTQLEATRACRARLLKTIEFLQEDVTACDDYIENCEKTAEKE